MDDYSDFYAILEVNPDTDWETLRKHYKRLIGQWHPDRFSEDIAARSVAEERSKRITIAYQALWNYRRAHGVLPPRPPPAEMAMEMQGSGRDAKAVPDDIHTYSHATRGPISDSSKERSRRPYGVALAIFIIVTALYFADRYTPPTEPDETFSRPDA